MIENLAIKHGYYFVIDRDDNKKIFNVEIGKGYKNDDVENFSVKSENGFLNFYINGVKNSIRDQELVKTFEEVADDFINRLVEAHTKNALVVRNGDNFMPYFDSEV